MAHGGRRVGAGRPTKEQAAEKERLLAETIANGVWVKPEIFLRGLLSSPGSSKAQKLKASELLMRYASEAPPRAPASAETPTVILAIPRGVFLNAEQIADPDQLIPFGVPLEPYAGTQWTRPASRAPVAEPAPLEVERFEVTELEPPENLVRLDSFKNRRDGDDGPGAP